MRAESRRHHGRETPARALPPVRHTWQGVSGRRARASEFVLDGVPIGQSGAELLEGVDHASRSLKTVLRYRNGNERASKCEAGARPCRRFERVKSFATALPRRWLSLLRSLRPVPSSQPSSGPFQGAGTRSVKASSRSEERRVGKEGNDRIGGGAL